MSKARIYTKTGDQGETSLVGGTRVPKTHLRLEAYGTLDELNSFLGQLYGHIVASPDSQANLFFTNVKTRLTNVQNNLFNIGSHLACETESFKTQMPNVSAGSLEALEKDMDQWESELEPLKQFILPGGTNLASLAHISRTVCRRAEREVVRLSETVPVDNEQIVYLNRLSDWLFLLARKLNQVGKVTDVPWSKG